MYKCIIQIKSKMMSHSQNKKKHKQKKRKFPKTIEIYIDFETVQFLFFWGFFHYRCIHLLCMLS